MFTVCLGYASDRDMAEDMLQEGFIRVFNNLKSFKKKGSFDGWVRRVFVNNCLNYIRTNKIGSYVYIEKDNQLENFLDWDVNTALYGSTTAVEHCGDGYTLNKIFALRP